MATAKQLTRRRFIKTASTICLPAIVPASVLGLGRQPAPSERVTVGCIGLGGQGDRDMMGLMTDDRVQVVALCDCDSGSTHYERGWLRGLAPAKSKVEAYYAAEKQAGTHRGVLATPDYRELLARQDIDAVTCSTPDHWHAAIVVAAARAGKDIYCQKPLSLTIADGQAMVAAVKRYDRIFQCGSQRRSDGRCRHACELVRNGRIGRVHTVHVGLPGGHSNPREGRSPEVMPVPKALDYDRWLGPTPTAPYTLDRCHWTFRWNLDYSGGQLTDWGAHFIDMAHWGMGMELTGPVEIEGSGTFPPMADLWNTPTAFHLESQYANGIKMIISNKGGGVRFVGTDGQVTLGGSDPKSIWDSKIGPGETRLYQSDNHYKNFVDCVISRKPAAAPVDVAHRSITPAHLGSIAMTLGRKLKWNPAKEEFVDDERANALRSRPYRAPWGI
ncbi:MAG: Gfo/Idh/MocA family oxidoreductase [Phycisphaeraceae bacterium]|nr:Gfo/Idh/MocA family oxidoreductase [Phycisphaeraceae bacterium]